MIYWIVTWVLLAANLVATFFKVVQVKKEAQAAMQELERRLKASARVRSSMGPTYQERLAEEYRKRGLSG